MMRRPVLACRCGSRRDEYGRCVHCDYPPQRDGCPGPDCPNCRERDVYCEVCKRRLGTPAGAAAHAVACRNLEARRERAA